MFSKIFKPTLMFPRFFQIRHVNGKKNFDSESKGRSFPVGILGAPFSKGQPKHGVDLAPDVIRKYGLVKQLQDLGIDIKDFGNIDFECDVAIKDLEGKLKCPVEVGSACQKVSESVRKVLLEGRKCVTLGGDHSLGIGTVYGHSLVHNLCLLWIDAHADINTPVTSLSGNIHGMPLAFLIKELQKYLIKVDGFDWLKPCVKKNNVAFIGLRDIDPLEKLILVKEDILHFSMRDVDELGIFEVTKRALNSINPNGNLSLHVSFDIDSIDIASAPSTGTPVLGGLTPREAICIGEEISGLDYFRALDIVEVNPALGSEEQIERTLNVTALIAKAFLGDLRQGRVPHNIHEIPIL